MRTYTPWILFILGKYLLGRMCCFPHWCSVDNTSFLYITYVIGEGFWGKKMCIGGIGEIQGKSNLIERVVYNLRTSSFQENYIWKKYVKMMSGPQEKVTWWKWHGNLVTDQEGRKNVLQVLRLYTHSSETCYKYLNEKYKVSFLSSSNWYMEINSTIVYPINLSFQEQNNGEVAYQMTGKLTTS